MTADNHLDRGFPCRNEAPERCRIVQCGAADRTVFPAQSSVLDEEALRERVLPLYDLPGGSSCRFLMRGDSDVYVVTTPDRQRFYLKAYRPPHAPQRAEAEAVLVSDLVGRGFPGVPAVKKRDGGYVKAILANEGVRPLVLWTEAPDERPELTPSLAEALGSRVAQFHTLADGLASPYALPLTGAGWPMELLPHALEFLKPADAALVLAAAQWVQEQVRNWPTQTPDFGICHGDLAMVNIRRHPVRGVTFFDFGEARYIWRLSDLRPFYPGLQPSPDRQAIWDGFRRGYSRGRPLPHGIDELMPVFRLMHFLAFLGKACAACPLRMGLESPEGFLPQDVQSLREQCRTIPALGQHLRDSLGDTP